MAQSAPIFTPGQNISRYALLDAMSTELADAFRSLGREVNPKERFGDRPPIFFWTNFLPEDEGLFDSITNPSLVISLMQFFVDHPLALDAKQMDRFSQSPKFRLALPCLDGAHLLRLRWPTLQHFFCLHGVPGSALCDLQTLEQSHNEASGAEAARPNELVVLGSIHPQCQIDCLWSQIPARVRKAGAAMVEMLLAYPWMPFDQALDIAIGAEGIIPGHWPLAAILFQAVMAEVNRRRRMSMVRVMQGIPTAVYGAEAWKEACAGTIRYAGQVPYDQVATTMERGRVCLAWGPTQFTHSFSERILLSMAAGCATVADDRLLVRQHFAMDDSNTHCAAIFDASKPESARQAVSDLLNDRDRAGAMALRGRRAVEQSHLWRHRAEQLLNVADEALGVADPVAAAAV